MGAAAADDIFELVFLAEGFPELAIFVAQFADFKGLLDDDRQVIERKRLGDEIDGALLHRLHCVFDGAEGRHHDHGRVHVLSTELFDKGEAVHARELEVGQNEVDIGGELESILGSRCGFDVEAGGGEVEANDSAVLFFVLNDEDGWTRHRSFYCALKGAGCYGIRMWCSPQLVNTCRTLVIPISSRTRLPRLISCRSHPAAFAET